jgi:hypothetical protein
LPRRRFDKAFVDRTRSEVGFAVTTAFGYYLDHIIPRAALEVGDIVHAGAVVGMTNPGGAIDLGAYDLSTPRFPGRINPTRYGEETPHCVDPFKYFVEPMRSFLYSRQRRVTCTPPEAHIDFDVAGRLIGNWYESSLPVTSSASMGPEGWPKQLAFVADDRVRVEVFEGSQATTAEFDARALVYIR